MALAFAGLASLYGASSFVASPASALTVLPYGGGGGSTQDAVLWYAGQIGAPTDFVMDSAAPAGPYGGRSFYAVDLTRTLYNDTSSLTNAIEFYLTADAKTAPTGGGFMYLLVTSAGQGTSAVYPVAIAGASGATCSSGYPNCLNNYNGQTNNTVSDPAGNRYFYAVPWNPSVNGTAFRVALYMQDVCTSYSKLSGGTPGQGCMGNTAGLTTTPVSAANSTVPLNLNFQLVELPSANPLIVPATLPAAKEQFSVNIRFQDNKRTDASGGRISCPTTKISYFPADSSILIDSSMFDAQHLSSPTGYAPMTTAVVTGAVRGSPSLTVPTPNPTGFPTGYLQFDRTSLGTGQLARGFTNVESTSDSAHTYDVAFLLRDAAGVLYTPEAAGSNQAGCILEGVQTSAIQGFLSKSSCFIATAAFRSIDAAPVAMLRQFRDQILFRSELGTSFVHWYYEWSPEAAEWLMLHPFVRYPVLRALVPLEIFAWFCLHPVALFWLFAFALAVGGGYVMLAAMRSSPRSKVASA